MDVTAPTPDIAVEGIDRFTPIIDRFPTTRIESDTDDGTKRNVEVHALLLHNPRVFGLVWEMAPYEPIVYARQGNRTEMGILSPNFDEYGETRLPSIKVLPLQTAYPLVRRGSDLLPDARMATMLAGSAHAEGKGSGGHDKPPTQDFEHKLAFLGAVSLDRKTIMQGGSHVQHAERRRSSVATGLTNGALGNIFARNGEQSGGFNGYGTPLVFQQYATKAADAIFFPKGFLHHEVAYGAHYIDAARIAYGASLQIMYERQGRRAVSDKLKQMSSTG